MVRLGSTTPAKPGLHSASIHISNFPEAQTATNPYPQGQGDRASAVREPLNQGFLSPMKLVQLTEEPDLSKVTYLELSINTSENSVGNFGKEVAWTIVWAVKKGLVVCIVFSGVMLQCQQWTQARL